MSRARAHPCHDAGCEARPSRTLSQASSQPVRRLCRILAEQRDNGREFNTAWPAAVAAAIAGLDHDERLAWARAFDATRKEWKACWCRQGPVLQLSPDERTMATINLRPPNAIPPAEPPWRSLFTRARVTACDRNGDQAITRETEPGYRNATFSITRTKPPPRSHSRLAASMPPPSVRRRSSAMLSAHPMLASRGAECVAASCRISHRLVRVPYSAAVRSGAASRWGGYVSRV